VSEQTFHHALMWGWLILAVPVFVLLMFVAAPYGRHFSRRWGPSIRPKLGWFLMEIPAAFVFAACVLAEGRPDGAAVLVFLVLWQTHYLHRAFIYPALLRSRRRMSLAVILMAVVFNVINGYINGRWLGAFSSGYEVSWLWDPRFVVGATLWVIGFVINLHSDHVLREMRGQGASGYGIPRRGLYRWVSSPNYLGEIVEWTGWAIATWSLAGLTFAVWTFANLAPRAMSHHRWYRDTFDEYPAERKAVIPFLL
jgi:hypothetical protein